MFAEVNLYSRSIICLYLDPRATLTVKMNDSEELGSDSMIAQLLSGFIIALHDFSVDKELIGMSGFITTQFCYICRNCVKT